MGWNLKLKNSDDRHALESTTPSTTKTVSWLKDPGLRPLNFGLFFLLFGDVAHGFDGSLINNLQQINKWQEDFDHPRKSLLGALSASYWIGNILGVVLIPLVADRLGRRIAIAAGSLLCIGGAAICAATTSNGAFIAGRILLGMGGVISPRWLCSRGKEQTALDILAKYHGAGNVDDAVVQHEYAEIRDTIEAEITQNKNPFHLKALFATPGNRWRSFIIIWCGICKQWSGNGLVSYYLGSMLKSAGITKQIETTLITATSQMFSFACSFAFAFLPARVGRRPLMLTSMAGMWIVFAVITATSGAYVETGNRHASYTTGMAMFSLVAGICGAFNTYVNPLGIAAMSWKFYFFYVGWIIVQFVVVYLVFPETKGPSLEQIALLFDGKDAQVGRVNAVADEMLDEKEGGVAVETRERQ
ncbi:hexose transporter protein [Colletotrichum higginsianum]|nr:hexose transporter protein [Colletotrichum higginsianum]